MCFVFLVVVIGSAEECRRGAECLSKTHRTSRVGLFDMYNTGSQDGDNSPLRTLVLGVFHACFTGGTAD